MDTTIPMPNILNIETRLRTMSGNGLVVDLDTMNESTALYGKKIYLCKVTDGRLEILTITAGGTA